MLEALGITPIATESWHAGEGRWPWQYRREWLGREDGQAAGKQVQMERIGTLWKQEMGRKAGLAVTVSETPRTWLFTLARAPCVIMGKTSAVFLSFSHPCAPKEFLKA